MCGDGAKSHDLYNEGVAHRGGERLQAFLASRGFRVAKVPFYDDEALALLRGIPEAWEAAFRKLLKASCLWVMTADLSCAGFPSVEGAKRVENLAINYSREHGELRCKAIGRIDTISAPALMEALETHYDGTSGLRLDAEELYYISSAGLRVLLMAVRKLGQGSVTVVNASETVREIFKATGFDQMIAVE